MIRRITTILLLAGVSSSFLFSQNSVKVFSNFESGSLGDAQFIDSTSFRFNDSTKFRLVSYNIHSRFDPVNPVDTALPPSARWYYFLMTGIDSTELHLNFHHSDTRRPFYSYDGVNFERFKKEDCTTRETIVTRTKGDSLYIAYFPPYTFTRLRGKIKEWAQHKDVETENIGLSTNGRPMYILTITDRTVPDSLKKVIYMHARVHTSESPASWHLEKVIDILASDDEYAESLRKNFVFYILPFTNPDGVYEGLSRSNADGVNFEINWDKPDSLTTQEVKNIRTKLLSIMEQHGNIDILLNMHSQSANHITYYVHSAESTNDYAYRCQLLLSNLTIDSNPHFAKGDLFFSNIASRYVEGWLWNLTGDKSLAITFETPYTYYSKNPNGDWVTIENLQSTAINTLYAIGDYFSISGGDRYLITPPDKKPSSWKKSYDQYHVYFGDSYYVSKRRGAQIKYQCKDLPKGKYLVYKWAVGEVKKVSGDGENEWVLIDTVEHLTDEDFTYKYKSEYSGEGLTNILLIKE